MIFQRGTCPITCTEQQQDLHAQVLVIGHLQSDKLITDLQHLLTLVGHEGQLHTLPERKGQEKSRDEGKEIGEQFKTVWGQTLENRKKGYIEI